MSTTPATPSLKRIVLRNTAFLTAGSLALKVINFLFRIFMLRQLGVESFGQYSTVLAFVGLFGIFVEFGMSQYAMREMARRPEGTRGMFWNLVVMRLALALAGVAIITAAAVAVGYPQVIVLGVFLFTWTFVLSAFEAPLRAVLEAGARFEYVTALTVVGQVGFTLLAAWVLASGLGTLALVAVGLIAMLPQIALAAWFVRRLGLGLRPPTLSRRICADLVRGGLPFGWITLMLTISFSIDTVMLSHFTSASEVGWYNAAYGLSSSMLFFTNGFIVAIVPTLARAFVDDPAEVQRWYARSTKFIALLSIPIAVGGMLLAEPLIVLLYGEEFRPAAAVFRIIVWDVPFLMYASFCGNMTTIVGAEHAAARVNVVNAAANVVLNLIAIPAFGMIGAAAVTVITDAIAAGQFHHVLGRRLARPRLAPALARIGIAALAMGVIVFLVRDAHVLVAIALGAAAYGILAVLTQAIAPDERALLARALRHVAHGATRALPGG